MFESLATLASLTFWHPLLLLLNCAGILTWCWLVVCFFIPARRKDFSVPLGPRLLWLYRILMTRGVFELLLVGGVSLFISVFFWSADRLLALLLGLYSTDLPAFYVTACSLALAIPMRAVLGAKGWSLPLGGGLMVSIERAPKLPGIRLSKYVLCFHAGAKFFDKSKAGRDRVVKALRQLRQVSDQYDVVLKSWFFSEHSEERDRRVGKFRILMGRIRTVVIMALLQIPLLVIALRDSMLPTVPAFFMGLMVIAVPLVWLMTRYLRSASRLMRKISAKRPGSVDLAPSSGLELLHREIARRARGYRCSFITHQPISRTHLVGLSLRTSRVLKTCGGAEAGMVLHPLVGPVQPDRDWGKPRKTTQAPEVVETEISGA